MTLFYYDGYGIKLHSGTVSTWKVDCDALSDEDIEALARAVHLPPFDLVLGIPEGGFRLSRALVKRITRGANRTLVVDDVWTSGASMRYWMSRMSSDNRAVNGLVIFARSPVDEGVTAIWQLAANMDAAVQYSEKQHE